mgnify:CR=1 FL=1
MKELKEGMKRAREMVEELRTIDAHEAEANQTIEEVLAGGRVDAPSELERLSRARTVLDIAQPHRKRAGVELAKAERAIRAALDVARSDWNRRVKALREEIENQIVQNNVEFFRGDAARAKRWLLKQAGGLPFDILKEAGRCHWQGWVDRVPEGDATFWLRQAESFLAHCKACEKRFPRLSAE